MSYLLAALGYLHQLLVVGQPWMWSQVGGVHHETLVVFFWFLGGLFGGFSLW